MRDVPRATLPFMDTVVSHSRFSPSSAHRWVICQQSLIPVEGDHYVRDEEDDQYSSIGSACHALAAWALSTGNDPIVSILNEMMFRGLQITGNMAEAVSMYVEHVNQLRNSHDISEFSIEERVHIPSVHEDMYGTPDVSLFSESERHLWIGDGKFGWEAVNAEMNWQMISYAIGLLYDLEDRRHEIDNVTMFIVQPLDTHTPIKSVTYKRSQFEAFKRKLKAATKGNAVKPGDHCKRCRRAPVCVELEAYANELLDDVSGNPKRFSVKISKRSPEEIAAILDREEATKIWFAAVAMHAKQLLLLKMDVPGYELDRSLSNRAYINKEHARKVLHAIYGDDIYEPRVLRSPAGIERIDPKAKAILNGTEGKPALCNRHVSGLKLKRKQEKTNV